MNSVQFTRLECVDPASNQSKYYELVIFTGVLEGVKGNYHLLTRYARIGVKGNAKEYKLKLSGTHFATKNEFDKIVTAKTNPSASRSKYDVISKINRKHISDDLIPDSFVLDAQRNNEVEPENVSPEIDNSNLTALMVTKITGDSFTLGFYDPLSHIEWTTCTNNARCLNSSSADIFDIVMVNAQFQIIRKAPVSITADQCVNPNSKFSKAA